MEIPENIFKIASWTGVALIGIAPVLILLGFGNYNDQINLAMFLAFASRMGAPGNVIWILPLIIMMKLELIGIYLGATLGIIGFGFLVFLCINTWITDGLAITLREVLLWIGLGFGIVGPILTLVGFQANLNNMMMATLIGISGLISLNPTTRFISIYFFIKAPKLVFAIGIVLLFQSLTIILISKIMELQEE
ncbi:MAG: hypothetical protein ACTSO9_13905 [Candidatus Helarchaeota archaeon]